ncbi:hypothetical protein [Kaistia algarum]|uniref:hypothetical protein n=1 Tax=Kaistia algarum TaxID=2083279 RepID=UPI001056E687|nr:hypothetical protein [Kaistia algarum]MCX5514901.1 hypothetical protein [Kaistia algarum]
MIIFDIGALGERRTAPSQWFPSARMDGQRISLLYRQLRGKGSSADPSRSIAAEWPRQQPISKRIMGPLGSLCQGLFLIFASYFLQAGRMLRRLDRN